MIFFFFLKCNSLDLLPIYYVIYFICLVLKNKKINVNQILFELVFFLVSSKSHQKFSCLLLFILHPFFAVPSASTSLCCERYLAFCSQIPSKMMINSNAVAKEKKRQYFLIYFRFQLNTPGGWLLNAGRRASYYMLDWKEE